MREGKSVALFQIIDDEGRLGHCANHAEVETRLSDLLEEYEGGGLSTAAYFFGLKQIIVNHPDHIETHVHIGDTLMAEGGTKAALVAYQRAVLLGEAAIPAGYTGRLSWDLANRPFLRALCRAATCQRRLGNRKKTIALMERSLTLNPADALNIRLLLGSEYLRARATEKARFLLESWATDYPPCAYDLGLMLFREHRHAAAATILRLAFMANSYVAEMLCGHPAPAPLAIWHGTFASLEVAQDYVEYYGTLWHKTHDALPFLHWLFHQPKIMAERAALMDCDERLAWEHDVIARQHIQWQKQILRDQFDEQLSQTLTGYRRTAEGRSVLPWWRL
ncbi:hypothetical protein ASE85_07685 [Sphingobium sp. Leaf26]|nr:hypothetical protein ASE85_07685 [Sphingobium sp. Leaf26]